VGTDVTRAEGVELARMFVQTWPAMKIPPEIWVDVFADLDAGTAGTAFIRARNEEERPPNVAQFLTRYRALDTTHNAPVHRCATCGGDGMVTDRQMIHAHTYDVLRPCPDCDSTDAQRVLHDMAAGNNDELDRLIPGRSHAFHDVPSLPRPRSDSRPITFDAYVARLTQRAGMGDTDAEEMLAVWEQNLDRFGPREQS
jgi:hypothetical protein